MGQYDMDRSCPDRIELGWIARVVYSSAICNLTCVVSGTDPSSKNRVQSEVDPTWARHTAEYVS